MKPVCSQVKIKVPATSANLGSGFDTVGVALDYYDRLTFSVGRADEVGQTDNAEQSSHLLSLSIQGEGEDSLPRDETNLVVSTFRKACRAFGLERLNLRLTACNHIPQARGMGSSAAAIVAAIAAASAFSRQGDIDRQAVFAMAASFEGHPDNVAPAIYGDLNVSWRGTAQESKQPSDGHNASSVRHDNAGSRQQAGLYRTVQYPVDPNLSASIFVPDFKLRTEDARKTLPREIPFGDAVYNLARVALLPAAMNAGAFGDVHRSNALLFAATQDKLHQPYRKALMPASWNLIEYLRARGYAAAISGAGPCVVVLSYGDEQALAKAAQPTLGSDKWQLIQVPVSHSGVQVDRFPK